jgi:hypothetical protein
LEGKQNPDRDAQFSYINEQVKDHQADGQPVISVDTKKKELVGHYKNSGRQWRPHGEPTKVDTHDFPDQGTGKAVPYGIYDLTSNTGWVNVGTDHDTAAFAVESVRRWWNSAGHTAYPDATRLLITADAGGSNGYRTRAWKAELAALATHTGLTVTVCHFPPGTSKWNTIEHRLFSHITMNWRGRPLTSHEVVVNTIAATTTRTGLTVHAELDTDAYDTGIQVSDAQMNALPLDRHPWHGDWNYTLHPTAVEHAMDTEVASTARPDRPDHGWLRHPALTGLTTTEWDTLITRLTALRDLQRQAALHDRRGGRHIAAGAGGTVVFTLPDRVLATILRRRFRLPGRLAATLLGVCYETVNRAVRETGPLLALAGHTPAPTPTRIRTLADLMAYTADTGIIPASTLKPAS